MLDEYLDMYDLDIEPELASLVAKHPRKEWMSFKNKDNEDRVSPDGLDLIDKFLRYDPAARVLPKEAMKHKFFSEVQK